MNDLDAQRRPLSKVIRFAVVLLLWLVVGVFCCHNYVTDACAPDVERREALISGILAPLNLAGAVGSAPCVPDVALRPVAAYGYLIAWAGLTFMAIRARTFGCLAFASLLITALYFVGGCCLLYMNEHAYS